MKSARMLPAFAFVIPMEAKSFQFAPDFFDGRDVEFQPNPFADNLGLFPDSRQFAFHPIQQGKCGGHICIIRVHGKTPFKELVIGGTNAERMSGPLPGILP
jgi:hypothetical protein